MEWFRRATDLLGDLFGGSSQPREDVRQSEPQQQDATSTPMPNARAAGRAVHDAIPQSGVLPSSPPVLQECISPYGGVQSLCWYAAGQRQDRDGDLCTAFLMEGKPGKNHMRPQKSNPPDHPLKVHRVEHGNVILTFDFTVKRPRS